MREVQSQVDDSLVMGRRAVEGLWKENRAPIPRHPWVTYLSLVIQLIKILISLQNWVVVEFLLCFPFVITVLVFKKNWSSSEAGAWCKLHEQNCRHKHSKGSVVSGNCRLRWDHEGLYNLAKIQPQTFPHGRTCYHLIFPRLIESLRSC